MGGNNRITLLYTGRGNERETKIQNTALNSMLFFSFLSSVFKSHKSLNMTFKRLASQVWISHFFNFGYFWVLGVQLLLRKAFWKPFWVFESLINLQLFKLGLRKKLNGPWIQGWARILPKIPISLEFGENFHKNSKSFKSYFFLKYKNNFVA